MKPLHYLLISMAFGFGMACNQAAEEQNTTGGDQETASSEPTEKDLGMAGIQDDESQKNILQIALGSKDHSTLVAAVQTAGIEHVLSNTGPLTVFAPVNAAFDALPAGTVEDLLKPENQGKLRHILYHHAAPEVYDGDLLSDGRQIFMADGSKVTVKVEEDGSISVDGAKILATIPASNGVIHVVDKVILPAE